LYTSAQIGVTVPAAAEIWFDGTPTGDLYAQTHRHVDRLLLLRVPEVTSGNQNQAARMLGIARQTLRGKLRDLGLSVSQSVEAAGRNLL
jgi:DNA-binding protein Fis